MTVPLDYRWSLPFLSDRPPPFVPVERCRNDNLSRSLRNTLDRVNALGDGGRYGHKKCVNALSWARHGELLLSGGDDTTVRIWQMDLSNTEQEFPFVCRSVINTGHQANIFNAHMMPHSSRIVTAAGDNQIRVFDIGTALTTAPDGIETQYSASQAGVQIIRCHEDRVKRIVTEDSPDLFLSVGEDGYVRQHDLRAPHNCRRDSCPSPLMKVGHDLSALSLSPLTPYQFVAAGESPYGYLCDRRHFGRVLREEWGVVPGVGDDLTTCVRRFGRSSKASENTTRSLRDHITGVRVSQSNGHEVLLSYNGDGVYLYSTRDEPQSDDNISSSASSIVAPNPKRRKNSEGVKNDDSKENADDNMDENESEVQESEDEDEGGDIEAFIEFDNSLGADESNCKPGVPIIMPRRRYAGARNVATVKDVNFLGPNDEWVVSGSDDGSFFIWDKTSEALHGIYEGDSSIVNVIEGHPHLPVIAVSGIDSTVKLFAPRPGRDSAFSRMANAERIIKTNARLSRSRVVSYGFATLLARARAIGAESADVPECTSQ